MSDNQTFSKTEEELIKAVDVALGDGVALLGWWQAKEAKNDPKRVYDGYYKESETRHRDDSSYGFFGKVLLPSSKREVPINGNVQKMFYDEPKAPPNVEEAADEWMNKQVREFILNYFMRISDYRQPQPVGSGDGGESGFGFSQVYYKRVNGEARKFDEKTRDKIVDLREFEKGKGNSQPYEWIVLKNPIFGFGFNFQVPLVKEIIGVPGPQVKIPADVFNYLVLSKDFIVHQEIKPKDQKGDDPIVGRYGFGYAFVNDPEPSVYGYGPGALQPAFEQMVWEVHKSGKVRVQAAFVAQEPRGILNLSMDPLAWGFQFTKALGGQVPGFLRPVKRFWDGLPMTNMTFDPVLPTVALLNTLTMGQAGRFGLSKEEIIKEALYIHFLQHYNTILGSLQTWRQIKDWTNARALPRWVVSGKST